MLIYKGKLEIELEENVEKLNIEIKQLKALKKEIIKSSSYYLLDGKTQMIDVEVETEIRSRLGHTISVATISKQIIGNIYDECSTKKISDTELFKLNKQREQLYAEIIALAHDLGHTPYGHSGEAVVNEFMQSITDKETIDKIIEHRKQCFGEKYEEQQGHTEGFEGRLSFEHNEQSALEFKKLVDKSQIKVDQIDINKITMGILAHSISRVPDVPKDLAGQIVRQADKIEYRNADFTEIEKFVILSEEDRELINFIRLSEKQRIKMISDSVVNEAIQKGIVDDDNDSLKITKRLRKKYEKCIYLITADGKRGLLKGNNRERSQVIYRKLLEYYYQHPEKIPTKSLAYNNPINESHKKQRVLGFDKNELQGDTNVELVIQYINTFTNKKCMDTYLRLVKERIVKGNGYGIEPITPEEIEERKKMQIEEEISKMRGKDIYTGKETHTTYEYLKRIQFENNKFMTENLTQEARDIMEKNRLIHEQENKIDESLYNAMIKADELRATRKEIPTPPWDDEQAL